MKSLSFIISPLITNLFVDGKDCFIVFDSEESSVIVTGSKMVFLDLSIGKKDEIQLHCLYSLMTNGVATNFLRVSLIVERSLSFLRIHFFLSSTSF